MRTNAPPPTPAPALTPAHSAAAARSLLPIDALAFPVRSGRSARGHLQDQRLHQECRDQSERVHHAHGSGELSLRAGGKGGRWGRATRRLRCCSGPAELACAQSVRRDSHILRFEREEREEGSRKKACVCCVDFVYVCLTKQFSTVQ